MSSSKPYVTITEQPAAKSQRFRYLSEVDGARSVGSIPGVSSTAERRTYPTIRVHGHKGPFLVLLSLLNPDNDLVHPHSITGSDPRYTCRNGVVFVISDEPEVVFKNIGILCVKGKTEQDVQSALRLRKTINVDPFGAGFTHIKDHRRIDFTAVRLCFQVFLPGPDWTPVDRLDLLKYTRSLSPIASHVVYDAKKLNDLRVVHVTYCAGPLTGGTEMTLLCDKYTGQNPDVVFDDGRGWTQVATAKMHHKQLAIVFVAPPYREERDPRSPDYLKVQVYLRQANDRGVLVSQSVPVEYLPNPPKGSSTLQFPKQPQSEKPRISLKQVRMHRHSPGSPEDGRQKRGRSSNEDCTSQTDVKPDNNAQSETDVHGRADALPFFDPENPELLTHEWISKIDHLGSKYNWSDTVKAYYMQKRLTGIAKDWLSSIRHSDSVSWPEWKEKLLEAFPPRTVSYLDLLLWRSKMIKEDKSKIKLDSVHEMNAKRAYACLIEGWPLQMKTSARWVPETHHSLHPDYIYLADREDPRNNAPQIRPMNLNKADHKLGINVNKHTNPFHGNIEDYRYEMISPDEERTESCCCKDDTVCVIRRCPTLRQNEMRPSCIIRHNPIPLERSWHQPCSTLTSSSSSPSIANPAPDWSTDQLLIILPAYTQKAKAEERALLRELILAVFQEEFSPPVVNLEADISAYNSPNQHMNIASSFKPLNTSNISIQRNNLVSNINNIRGSNTIPNESNDNTGGNNTMIPNTHGSVNTAMAKINLNPTLTSPSGASNVALGSYKFSAKIPSGTKIKRSVSEHNRDKPDSGEILAKREKPMPLGFPEFGCDTSPAMINAKNPFLTSIDDIPTSVACLPLGQGHINEYNQTLFQDIMSDTHLGSIMDEVANILNTGQTWHENILASMTADHNNVNISHFDQDHNIIYNDIDHNNPDYNNVELNSLINDNVNIALNPANILPNIDHIAIPNNMHNNFHLNDDQQHNIEQIDFEDVELSEDLRRGLYVSK